MKRLKFFLIFTSLLFIGQRSTWSDEMQGKYNFLFIFVDDQGWTGTSVPMLPGDDLSRTRGFSMPNLEAMAKTGMVFSQAYAGHPKCECSRASLLMGRTTTSLNTTDKNARRWNAPVTDSIANTLKKADPNYRAAHFGKWQWPQSPESMGFDASDGITMNEDGDSADPLDPKQSFGITRRAVSYMKKQADEKHPFYLQLSYYAVHSQPQALATTLKKYQATSEKKNVESKNGRGGQAIQAAMSEDLDTCIGELLKMLGQLDIAKNTMLIYMADNGMRSSGLKGGKTVLYEGGIRVPLIVNGPGVSRGVYCNEPVVGYDIFPTVVEMAAPGFGMPVGIEGGSWRELLLNQGKGQVKRPIDRMVWHHDVEIEHPQTAMRQGNFKLLHYWDTRQDFLYDLSVDRGESKNLAAERPDQAEKMLNELKSHVKSGLGDAHFGLLESGKIQASPRGGAGKAATKKGGGRDAAKKINRPKNADQ